MAEATYLDFDLSVIKTGDGYRAKGWSTHGCEGSVSFQLPDGLRPTQRGNLRDFGAQLFEIVFQGEVLGCFRASLEEARSSRYKGLRIRLRLAEVPELAELPWEYLYDKGLDRFFALSMATPVVRYLELPERTRPLEVEGPLRVLVMRSAPSGFEALDGDKEWQRLREALGDLTERGMVQLHRLEEPTLPCLQETLRHGTFHVFHFIGHGGFRERTQEGALIFEDGQGGGQPVTAEQLGVLLRDHSLRFALLNACEGARGSSVDPFAGVAQTLVRQGIPAVLGMQSEIEDDDALTLAHELYRALADGYPVDAAVTEARKALLVSGSEEWGTPVLYLRAPDGKLFDNSRAILVQKLDQSRRRRRRLVLLTAGLLIIALVLAFQERRTAREADRADRERETAHQVSDFLIGLFEVTDPVEDPGVTLTVREILDRGSKTIGRLSGQPEVQETLLSTLGRVYGSLGLYDDAAPLLKEAVKLRRQELGEGHPDVAVGLNELGLAFLDAGDVKKAETRLREAYEMSLQLFGEEHRSVAASLHNLGRALAAKAEPETAEQHVRRALDIQRRVLGESHPEIAAGLNNLGAILHQRGDLPGAEECLREALEQKRRIYGDSHNEVAVGLNNLAVLLRERGNDVVAAKLYEEAIVMYRELFPDGHRNLGTALVDLALLELDHDDPVSAEPRVRDARQIFDRVLPAGHWRGAHADSVLGACLSAVGRFEDAEPLVTGGYAGLQAAKGDDAEATRDALERVVVLYEVWGRPEAAERYRALRATPDIGR